MYSRPLFKLNLSKNNSKLNVLADNLIDALIDGCIAGLMTGWLVNPNIGYKVALGVGLLKFFIRLKELRNKGEKEA